MQSTKQVVVFKLGDSQYGFPIEQVTEIIKYIAPSKIPKAPSCLEGIISLRGKVNAVLNLRNYLGIDNKEPDDNTKIIIANGNNVGFIVDEVNMIVTPKEEDVDTTINLPVCIDNNYILYILKINSEIIAVLNMERIIDMSKEDKVAI